jgi:hypothetical protein
MTNYDVIAQEYNESQLLPWRDYVDKYMTTVKRQTRMNLICHVSQVFVITPSLGRSARGRFGGATTSTQSL